MIYNVIYILQNSINKPWAYICSKGFFAGLSFGELILEGAYYWEELGWAWQ